MVCAPAAAMDALVQGLPGHAREISLLLAIEIPSATRSAGGSSGRPGWASRFRYQRYRRMTQQRFARRQDADICTWYPKP